ncbi:low temperature requirement protein LtrA [Luteibacter rhizovicinus]|uniref:Low temperature requirement protein LtrA n=1 Tax=Luteibacter rhizovicinus TaxID=242606 RepID=A0A4R3YTU5_9GAMM|nr:low temperature requirement protein A [Luteibacter rhizovicinus]TCV96377.1 low temperature requirement protein LtrA [Luteibacter rhizovicinus]
MKLLGSASLLRARDGHEAKVSNIELFFDLVYMFAVTQLSHHLLTHMDAVGALQTLVLWFAVWLGWQYTSWVTNWFDPERLPVRVLIIAIMLVGLVMAASIPEAFVGRGLAFAACYVTIQVGRTLLVLLHLGRDHSLAANFRRMLVWLCIAAVFWIAGAFATGSTRMMFWIVAVLCEYISPMTGFRLPFLGRSSTRDWTIEGGHLAERCQLFVIVALGESVLAVGASFAHVAWDMPILIALLTGFIASVAMWWLYFDTSSGDGSETIVRSTDPGRVGAYFHYVHVTLVGGIIVGAVGNDLIVAEPAAHSEPAALAVLVGGPALYLIGNLAYKAVVYGRVPLSHLAGLAALAVVAALGSLTDHLMVGGLVTLVLVGVAIWESCSRRMFSQQEKT